MVQQIIDLIYRNRHLFPGLDTEEDIMIAKFYHSGKNSSKVLFIFSIKDKTTGIIKIMRSSIFNNFLEAECNNQKNYKIYDGVITAPNVLFEDRIGDLFVYAEEIIKGNVWGEKSAEKNMHLVIDLLNKTNKGDRVAKEGALSWFDGAQKIDAFLSEKISNFNEWVRQENNDLYHNIQHGDFTYMNIIETDRGQQRLIDWDRAGERNIWGIDFCHYLIRAKKINNQEHFLSVLNKLEGVKTKEKLLGVYFLDVILDYMYKKYYSEYLNVIGKIKTT